jgi:NDP-sugar pyrophosphorylase family protein
LAEVTIVVLAGGLGTRLASVLEGLPKIMAPVAGRPFLDYLLGWLSDQGARSVTLSLGHRAGPVQVYLSERTYEMLEIRCVLEPSPLGTAGAVAYALPSLSRGPVMVMNGDTFVDVDLGAFLAAHRSSGATASVVCAHVDNPGRYGRVEIDSHNRITCFMEKSGHTEPSWINAGVYLFERTSLEQIQKLRTGSLERDVLQAMPPGEIHAFCVRGRFLDIGTPETLAQAPEFFGKGSPDHSKGLAS